MRPFTTLEDVLAEAARLDAIHAAAEQAHDQAADAAATAPTRAESEGWGTDAVTD